MEAPTFRINDIKNPKAKAFLEYIKTLEFIVIEKTQKKTIVSKEKQQVLNGLKQAVKEINLIKQGKMKARNAQDFLDEL